MNIDWSGPLTAPPTARQLLAWVVPSIPLPAAWAAVAVPSVRTLVDAAVDAAAAWTTLAAVTGDDFTLDVVDVVRRRSPRGRQWRYDVDAIRSALRDYAATGGITPEWSYP